MSGNYPFHSHSPKNNYSMDFSKPQFSPGDGNGDFIPLGFSSPVNRGRGNHNNSWRGGFHRRSHRLSSGHNSSCSPYNSPYNRNNRTFNNRSGRKSQNRSSNSYQNCSQEENSSSLYYHPSMLEDPWAELEEKYKSDGEDEKFSTSQNKSTDSNIINLSDDSNEASNEQDTDDLSLTNESHLSENITNPD